MFRDLNDGRSPSPKVRTRLTVPRDLHYTPAHPSSCGARAPRSLDRPALGCGCGAVCVADLVACVRRRVLVAAQERGLLAAVCASFVMTCVMPLDVVVRRIQVSRGGHAAADAFLPLSGLQIPSRMLLHGGACGASPRRPRAAPATPSCTTTPCTRLCASPAPRASAPSTEVMGWRRSWLSTGRWLTMTGGMRNSCSCVVNAPFAGMLTTYLKTAPSMGAVYFFYEVFSRVSGVGGLNRCAVLRLVLDPRLVVPAPACWHCPPAAHHGSSSSVPRSHLQVPLPAVSAAWGVRGP